jgi:hypothetical protein
LGGGGLNPIGSVDGKESIEVGLGMGPWFLRRWRIELSLI